mmetsp:Transcript_14232/g.39219  ORF Transcript_14232/g.39219 Transcript_14232/m.39219 type:complete len:419 (+) Transcript_14232:29-1285(+)
MSRPLHNDNTARFRRLTMGAAQAIPRACARAGKGGERLDDRAITAWAHQKETVSVVAHRCVPAAQTPPPEKPARLEVPCVEYTMSEQNRQSAGPCTEMQRADVAVIRRLPRLTHPLAGETPLRAGLHLETRAENPRRVGVGPSQRRHNDALAVPTCDRRRATHRAPRGGGKMPNARDLALCHVASGSCRAAQRPHCPHPVLQVLRQHVATIHATQQRPWVLRADAAVQLSEGAETLVGKALRREEGEPATDPHLRIVAMQRYDLEEARGLGPFDRQRLQARRAQRKRRQPVLPSPTGEIRESPHSRGNDPEACGATRENLHEHTRQRVARRRPGWHPGLCVLYLAGLRGGRDELAVPVATYQRDAMGLVRLRASPNSGCVGGPLRHCAFDRPRETRDPARLRVGLGRDLVGPRVDPHG